MVSGGLAVEPDARRTNDWALALVGLPELMARTAGALTVPIGFLDGPVAIDHPDLAGAGIRAVNGRVGAACISPFTAAYGQALSLPGSCLRDAARELRPSAPTRRCSCVLSSRPPAMVTPRPRPLQKSPREFVDAVTAGARVLNLSAATTQAPTTRVEHQLHQSLDFAASRGVLVELPPATAPHSAARPSPATPG